jgi:transposase-like protein
MSRVAELSFEDKDLSDRWNRVREDFWGDLKGHTLKALQRLLETSMEIEVQDLIGSPHWEHSLTRPTYRNGHYRRDLLSGLGWIVNLKVPRVRHGGMRFKTLPRYLRRTKDVDAVVLEMFLAGVSTRRVEEVLRPLMGERALSAQTVSRISRILDFKVSGFHQREIPDDYLYLILDGIYLKAKSPVHSRRRCILVVYGIRADGVRELIDYRLARKGESQAAWEGFLTSLKNRGLEGRSLQLAVLDGNRGLWNALDMVWPDVPRQRCWAHKLRNVANHLPKKLQPACMDQARDIYDAANYTEAVRAFKRWERIWKPLAPAATACLEQDFEDMLRFFQTPKSMWVKLRTTNIIERVFREVRRRTRPMSCFTNTQSVDRIIYAIFNRQNNLWREKPLREITQKT